ncbi:MAG: N-acetylmuramoyl-L-alanine amidase [Deltaproteobacteria bacterium]|nr:N-acetylmuramoyl-L-alanine amidase [Deltaproteobacteria bacterium]
MKRGILYFILICLSVVFLAVPPGLEGKTPKAASELLEKADRSRKALYGSAKKKRYRHNWIKCAAQYEAVYDRDPKSPSAAPALYKAADLYMRLYKYANKSQDLDTVIALYEKLVSECGDHFLADDAQYNIGEIYHSIKNDPSQAYVEFLKVDVRFPKGDMRPEAKEMLDKLAVTLNRGMTRKNGAGAAIEKQRAMVQDIRYWSTPNYTRVVIDVKSPVKYEHHLLKADPGHKKPRRLYLDLHHARVSGRIDSIVPIKDDLLQKARAGQYTEDTVRVVLDTKKLVGYNVFHLYDPFRIVVDVRGFGKRKTQSLQEPVQSAKKRKITLGIKKTEKPEQTISLARQLGLNVNRIVIDPGHGGKDPGCETHRKYKEKDITLALAKRLARRLKKEIGCEVFLTRDKDDFLSLEQRTAIANMKKADLFISLHVNAHKDTRVHGLETYFLNMATDQQAVMVAARENATSERSISDLQTILNDLMMNTKIRESSRLAHQVQKGMVGGAGKRYKGIRNLGVKQAPFYVLIGAQMPAVLVEVGFLSNRTERKRLVNKAYQERFAVDICDGIKCYIESINSSYQGG